MTNLVYTDGEQQPRYPVTEEQKAVLQELYPNLFEAVYTVADEQVANIAEVLENKSFATNVVVNELIFMGAALACINAVDDGRVPNKEWFLNTCATLFDHAKEDMMEKVK